MKQSRPFYTLQLFLARQQAFLIHFVEFMKFTLTFLEKDDFFSNLVPRLFSALPPVRWEKTLVWAGHVPA